MRSLVILLLALLPLHGQPLPSLAPGYAWSEFHRVVPGFQATDCVLDDAGRLLVSTQGGLIARLEDRDDDGVAEIVDVYWSGASLVPPVLGLLWFQGELYVSHLGQISVLRDTNADGLPDIVVPLLTGLPNGWHQNNQLFTDGTRIYCGLGSVTDHAIDPDARSATLFSILPDGSGYTTVATGLRNFYDGVVHPTTGEIFGSDNGPNLFPGTPHPRDEFVRVMPGDDHGHPTDWGGLPPPAGVTPPLAVLPPHVAPTGIVVNRNQGFSGERDELLLATWTRGTSNLTRVRPRQRTSNGDWVVEFETFADELGGAMDMVFDDAGRLYVVEYTAGRILRIAQEHPATVVVEGPARLGQRVNLTLEAPDWPGHEAWLAASTLAPNPYVLAPGIAVHLDLNHPLFQLSWTPGNGIFDFAVPVVLDGSGRGLAAINVPSLPQLAGVEIHLQYSLWTPGAGAQVVAASPPVAVRVVMD